MRHGSGKKAWIRLISSSRSSVQSTPKPCRLISSCSTDVAPMIVDVTNGRESQKAMASAAGEMPFSSARFL